jgi:CBS domain-containing protein
MITKELMTTPPATCAPNTDLNAAVHAMRSHDCGFLPVVDSHQQLVGVLTDRDVCMAAGEERRPLGRISVAEAMSRPVFSCLADENLKTVLVTMAAHHVRRLPVIDKGGHLQGVLSIDDIVQAPQRRGGPSAAEVVTALKSICGHRPIEAAVH